VQNVYDFEANSIDGTAVPLQRFAGQVALVVNTASKCGFTPQYAGLEQLYQSYRDRGLVVLAFPCNQFLSQEPGSEKEIGVFCSTIYGVTFPLFAKLDVNGPHTHPLFAFLKSAAPGLMGSEAIKWNFTKFLVNRKGSVQARYAPVTGPARLASDVEALL
jgi:glutathione peroxidase